VATDEPVPFGQQGASATSAGAVGACSARRSCYAPRMMTALRSFTFTGWYGTAREAACVIDC